MTTLYVTASGLNLRVSPIDGHVLRVLGEGTAVQELDRRDGWVKVLAANETGWVSAQYVTATPPTEDPVIAQMCEQHSVAANLVRAVIAIESGGAALINGRVVIRFEPHILNRQWPGHEAHIRRVFSWDPVQTWKDHKMMGRDFHGNQVSEYEALGVAFNWAGDAAYQSISMGAPQIMGFHHKTLGYPSAQVMYELFGDPGEQIRAMFTFMAQARTSRQLDPSGKTALEHLREQNFLMFATIYNGTGQAASYAKLIQERI